MTFRGPIPIEVDSDVVLSPISDTFGRVDHQFIRRVFRERARILASKLNSLIAQLRAGEISQRVFVRQSMSALQQAYYTVFSLGALSADPFHVITSDDVRAIQDELLGERKFLRSFSRDLRVGVLELAPDLRANLYLAALRGIFELGHISALPDRPYDWVLGDTDHCQPCVEAALGGPYKKDEDSRLNLPVLPGIPGSGEVCQGLTRCGCTVRRPEFPVGHNLQLQLRQILNEVMAEMR